MTTSAARESLSAKAFMAAKINAFMRTRGRLAARLQRWGKICTRRTVARQYDQSRSFALLTTSAHVWSRWSKV